MYKVQQQIHLEFFSIALHSKIDFNATASIGPINFAPSTIIIRIFGLETMHP